MAKIKQAVTVSAYFNDKYKTSKSLEEYQDWKRSHYKTRKALMKRIKSEAIYDATLKYEANLETFSYRRLYNFKNNLNTTYNLDKRPIEEGIYVGRARYHTVSCMVVGKFKEFTKPTFEVFWYKNKKRVESEEAFVEIAKYAIWSENL